MKVLVFVLLCGLLMGCGVASRGADQGGAKFAAFRRLWEYNEMAEAAEKQRSHMKSRDSDRVVTPVVDGLVSEDPAIRERAVQILEGPYLTNGWLAIDHFERLTWEKLDGRGRGMYLWCWATHRRWDDPTSGRPLPQSLTSDLWTRAAKEKTALPYLKETGILLFKVWRSAYHPPAPIGDSLETGDRQRMARQYLSVFKTCSTDAERMAVAWMILDFHSAEEDTMLVDWYTSEAEPQQRADLVATIVRIINPARDDLRVRVIRERTEQVLCKRAPLLRQLANVAIEDWHPEAAQAGASLLYGLGKLEAGAK